MLSESRLVLLEEISKLPLNPMRILVTGATGFVGRNVAQVLSDAGHDVTATGRNRYAGPHNCKFKRVDIRSRQPVFDACQNQQVVIHAAAESSPWRRFSELESVNVKGTDNIIDGCLGQNVQRLVHISSSSVLFRYLDEINVSDDRPFPKKFACGYAQSKAAAESKVITATGERNLNAIVIRARAVFGRGDNTLVPRILDAYDSGRLRQIGNGENLTDLTFIDNLVWAVALALIRGQSGRVCTVTGGQPVKVWQVVRKILAKTGRGRPLRRIPYQVAKTAATLNESVHRVFRLGEPRLTRFTVGLLAKNQTFQPDAARQILGYQPIIPMDQAIQETIESLLKHDRSHSETQVKLGLFSTGYTKQRYGIIQKGQSLRAKVALHAAIGLIEHPEHGLTLFDTGYAPRFNLATSRFPYSLYRRLTPARTFDDHSAVHIVERLGFRCSDVRRILLSHFHGDHTCGLLDFPQAEIIATKSEWESVKGRTGISAVKRAFLPDTMPGDILDRLHLIDQFHDPGIGPFSNTFDLFRDGSVRLIPLPGHSIGQYGVLLQTGSRERKLLVADAVWSVASITSPLRLTWAFKRIAASRKDAIRTHQQLVEFHRQFPEIEIVPTHCPDVARDRAFGAELSNRFKSEFAPRP